MLQWSCFQDCARVSKIDILKMVTLELQHGLNITLKNPDRGDGQNKAFLSQRNKINRYLHISNLNSNLEEKTDPSVWSSDLKVSNCCLETPQGSYSCQMYRFMSFDFENNVLIRP